VAVKNASRLLAGSLALLVLAGLTVWSLAGVLPPGAKSNQPVTEFGADRAFAHVQTIGREVHVAGSDAAHDVRDYIAATLTGFGVQSTITDGVGASDALGSLFAMAQVNDVVATLPGTASTGTIFLIAHYDSVQISHGANDDGAGVSTLLETIRALKAGPALRNDLVFVFTDAEEACLCGAEQFVSQNPLAAAGGVALNFEARGANGPVIMFETAAGNAGVVDVYADAVPYPAATSVAVEVYRILPNDTDFSPFRDSGRFTGLNSAYIDGSPVYHSPQDRADYYNLGTLQQHGSNALAMARAFGAVDVPSLKRPAGEDATYFPVFSTLLVYPGRLVWPIAILALLVIAGLAFLGWRRGLFSWGRLAAGFGLAVIPLLAGAVLAQLLWWLLTVIRPGYLDMIDPWRPGWYRAGVVALVLTATLTWYALLRKRFGAWTLTIGGLAWLALLGLAFAALVPGGSYLASVPALAAGLAALIALALPAGWTRLLASSVGAAVGVVVLAPTVVLFFPALGLATGAAAALFASMLTLVLLPVFEWLFPAGTREDRTVGIADAVELEEVSEDEGTEGRRAEPVATRRRTAAPAVVAGVLAVAFVAVGLVVDQFDERHPEPQQLMYALDVDSSSAQWVSTDSRATGWVAQYVNERRDVSGQFPVVGADTLTGPAPVANLPAPKVTVVSDATTGGRRSLRLMIAPQRHVRLVYFQLPDATVVTATVQGREVPPENIGEHFGVLFHAPPDGGITVDLVLAGSGPLTIRAMDGSDGLDALPGFTPRPADVTAEGSHTSELILVAKTYSV
jgi:hypothetical protein